MRFAVRAARHTICAASILSLLASGGALAASCAYPGESTALQTRVLQTELMVAALTCSQKDKYNAFVHKFSDELVGYGGQLKSYFSRTRGGASAKELNALVTSLANEASQRSLKYPGNFCSDAAVLFDTVLKTEPKDLASLAAARPTANSHGIQSCQISSASKSAAPGS